MIGLIKYMFSVMYIAEYLSFIFTTPLNLELDALFIQIKCQDKIITKAKCKLPHTSTNFEHHVNIGIVLIQKLIIICKTKQSS